MNVFLFILELTKKMDSHPSNAQLSQIKNLQLVKTVSNDETPQETFSRLKDACNKGTLTSEDIMDGFNKV